MNWQLFLLVVIILAAVLLVWRSSGKKAGGCKCGCAHAEGDHEKRHDSAR